MILLTGTAHKLQVVTTGTADTTPHASWVDKISATDVTPGSTNTATIVTATTTDIVGSPAASVQRNVQLISIRNKHASAAQTVTVQHTDGTVAVEMMKITLAAGESLHYEDGIGWYVVDVSGATKLVLSALGRFLKYTLLTSGTTFTTGPATTKIRVRLKGGGAGGAGCTSVAAAASAGGGGGAGAYAEKVFDVNPNTNYTYAIGTAGNGASGALGGNGGSTTFTVAGVTVTAPGGVGAAVATALTTLSAYLGGGGASIATNGDLNMSGENGEGGVVLVVATPILMSGCGASGPLGSGGIGRTTVGNGNAAGGFGAGGGGAATGASAVRTGGNGSPGCVVVEEFS